MTLVCLIRCTAVGPAERQLAQRLSATFPRVVLVPNTEAVPPDLPAVPVNPDALAGLGFHRLPPNWGWFCGDFCFYVARAALPEASSFLLIESDVYLGARATRRLHWLIGERPDHAMAAELGLRGSPRFSKGLGPLGLDPRAGCIFPVVHAPARLVDEMAALRRRSLEGGRPINDEAVLAGAVLGGGHPYLALDAALPRLFGRGTFQTNPPHLAEALARKRAAEAYHPALPLQTILARIAEPGRGYNAHRLRRVLAEANDAERAAIKAALDRAAGAPAAT